MADDNAENVQPKNRAVVSQRVLFVRNLPFSTTDQDLEKLFSEIGPIKRCFVIRNKGKKLCKILHVAYKFLQPKFSVGFGKEIKTGFFIQHFNILLQANLFLKNCRGPGARYWCRRLRISHRFALMNLLKLRSHRYLARS